MPSAGSIKAGSAFIELSLRDKSLVDGLTRASRQFSRFGATVSSIGNRVTAMGTVMVAPLAAAVTQFTAYADSITNAADRAGVATSTISELTAVLAASGATIGDVETAFKTLQKQLFKVAASGDEAASPFSAIGLSVAELQKLTPEEQLGKIADAISRLPTQSLQAGAALEFLGRAGVKLLPALKGGSESLKAMREDMVKMGASSTGLEIGNADEFGDAVGLIGIQIKTLSGAIFSVLYPALKQATEALQGTVSAAVAWVRANPELIRSFAATATAILGVGVALKTASLSFAAISASLAALKVAVAVVTKPWALFAAAIGVAVFQITNWERQASTAAGTMREIAQSGIQGISDAMKAGDLAKAMEIAMLGARVAMRRQFAAMRQDWIDFFSGSWTRVLSLGLLEIFNSSLMILQQEAEIVTGVLQDKLKNLITEANTIAARNESGANRSTGRGVDADELELSTDAAARAAEEAAKERLQEQTRIQDEIAREAESVFERTRTAAEQYAAEIQKLDFLVQSGAISHDTYTRAVQEQQKVLRDANAEAIKGEQERQEATKERIKEISQQVMTDEERLKAGIQEIKDLVPRGLAEDVARKRIQQLKKEFAGLELPSTQLAKQFGGLQGAAGFFGGGQNRTEREQLAEQKKATEELKKINSKISPFVFA